MALGRQGAVQRELLIGWHEVPVAPGHVFYDRLNGLLDEARFDREVETLCAASYASGVGRPGVPPGRYFRMLLVGYFEGLESERGIAWRCADSLSLRQFLKLGTREAVPEHSTLSRTRARLPLEVHEAVFTLVLRLVAERGLVRGRRVGVDASTMEANAAMRSIVRREDGAGWQAMLGELARASGISTPSTDQLRQFDRTRKRKRVSNADWVSPTDPEARIARLKDGRTRLAYKPEHAVDLDSGAILAAEVHPGDAGDLNPDPRGHARGGGSQPRRARPRPGARRSHRSGRRQGLSRPRPAEAPRRRSLDDPDRRARTPNRAPLARR
jgi:transposase